MADSPWVLIWRTEKGIFTRNFLSDETAIAHRDRFLIGHKTQWTAVTRDKSI